MCLGIMQSHWCPHSPASLTTSAGLSAMSLHIFPASPFCTLFWCISVLLYIISLLLPSCLKSMLVRAIALTVLEGIDSEG